MGGNQPGPPSPHRSLSTSLGSLQANYCMLLLSSMTDTLAPGGTYSSKYGFRPWE